VDGQPVPAGPPPAGVVVDGVARLSPHQRRLFDILVDRPGGVTVSELAGLAASHEKTVRGHLEALRARNLVRSTVRPAIGRGRPSLVYEAQAGAPEMPGEYLASVVRTLVGTLAEDDGAARALGREWARDLIATGRFDARVAEPVREFERLFARMGCVPLVAADGALHLRHCPFMEPEIPLPMAVCALHQGAVELLGEQVVHHRPDRGLAAAELHARTPEGCLIRLREAEFPEGRRVHARSEPGVQERCGSPRPAAGR